MQGDNRHDSASVGDPSASPPPDIQFSEHAASLEETLLNLDHSAAPVFAVLDGAQFDNLPIDLMMGGFVSRALYRDRGDNNSEQIVTAPHMVWLDERQEKPDGRPPRETIPSLLALIGNRPAAVFWQCPGGGEALFKHLRSINVVMYPKEALPLYDQQFVEESEVAALFRHADANVLAQTIFALGATNQARLLAPATAVLCSPDAVWYANPPLVLSELAYDPRRGGMMRLSPEEARAVSAAHREGMAKLIAAEISATSALSKAELDERVRAAVTRASRYEIARFEELRDFVALDLQHGPEFETNSKFAEASEELSDLHRPPDTRLYYVKQICNRAET